MSWPIDTLTIQRFRGLRDVTLEGVGGINLLVGDNNSGKTSVLEAISIYSNPLDPYAWRRAGLRRTGGFGTLSVVEGLKWLFPQRHAQVEEAPLFTGDIDLKGEGRGGARRVHVEAHESDQIYGPDQTRTDRGEMSGSEVVLTRRIELNCQLSTSEGTKNTRLRFQDSSQRLFSASARHRGTGLPVEIISPIDHSSEELYIGRFGRAVFGDHKADMIKALQYVDPGIVDMEFLPPPGAPERDRGAIYLRHERSGRTPLSAFGDGVRRVLLMALTLVSAKGGDLLIDEIETAIHVSVLGNVFTWLVGACRAYDVQIFASTHSLEALDAILAADKDDLKAIVGYRFPSPEHAASPRRYEGDQLSRLRFQRGLDVR